MINNHKELSKEYHRLLENFINKDRNWVLAAKELTEELRHLEPNKLIIKYEVTSNEQAKTALQDLNSFVMSLIAKAAE